MIIIFIIYGFLLFIASVMDIKTRRIPVTIPIFLISVQTGYYGMALYKNTARKEEVIAAILCALIIFGLCYFCMLFGNLGGADTLILTCIGFQLSFHAFYTMLFSFVFSLPYCFFLHKQKKPMDYPFVPYITIAYIMTLLIMQIYL